MIDKDENCKFRTTALIAPLEPILFYSYMAAVARIDKERVGIEALYNQPTATLEMKVHTDGRFNVIESQNKIVGTGEKPFVTE